MPCIRLHLLKLGLAHLVSPREWLGWKGIAPTAMVALRDFVEHQHPCLLKMQNLLIKSNDFTENQKDNEFSNEAVYWW